MIELTQYRIHSVDHKDIFYKCRFCKTTSILNKDRDMTLHAWNCVLGK